MAVVDHFDVVEHGVGQLDARGPALAVHELILRR